MKTASHRINNRRDYPGRTPRAILSLLLAFAFLATAMAWSATSDEETVRRIVDEHMSTLQKTVKYLTIRNLQKKAGQATDLGKVHKDLGKMAKQIDQLMKDFGGDAFELDIKNYAIKDVSVEGNTAYVRVTETRRINIKNSSFIGLDTNYKTVNETFVLNKVKGQWKIDALNTLHLTNLNDISSPGGIMELVNSMGIGRLSTIMEDPNLTNFIQPILETVVARTGIKVALPGDTGHPPVTQETPTAPATPTTQPATAPQQPVATPTASSAAQKAPMNDKARRNLDMCQSNLRHLGEMIQLYARDHNGRYPDNLAQLKPEYIPGCPSCPGAGKDTYSTGYLVSHKPEQFTLYCAGHNHADAGIPFGYPQFTWDKGLVTAP